MARNVAAEYGQGGLEDFFRLKVRDLTGAWEQERPDVDRAALVSALRAYHSDLGTLNSDVEAALERLAHPRSRVVVTGQQAGLLTGPAYSVHKGADAALLARAEALQGVAAYRLGDYAAARAALKSSALRAPNADTSLWLGLSAYALGDYGAAVNALSESVKLNPTVTARQNLASALLAVSRYAEAEAILRGLISDDTRNAEAWYLLGLAQRSQGRDADARQAFKTAANLGHTKARGAL